MAQIRLAMAQMNAVVGDLAGNATRIREYVAASVAQDAHLVAVPEMALNGYPVEDMALRRSFVQASRVALSQLAQDLAADGYGDTPVVVGYLDAIDEGNVADIDGDRNPDDVADKVVTGRLLPQNCAAVLQHGNVVARYAKHHLPNYGVFDEQRIFAPGRDLVVVRIGCIDVAIAICEDLWQEGGPVSQTRDAGAELLLVLNGSPYEMDKDDARLELCQRRAAQSGATLAYLNLVGGQDELVFDGDSLVVNPSGEVLARGAQFAEDLMLVDLDLSPETCEPNNPGAGVQHITLSDAEIPAYERLVAHPQQRLEPLAEVWTALELGLGDYVRKNGFKKVCLGVSGGIDSTLVTALAADAIGGQNVIGVSNPSKYSSEHSVDDAADLCERVGADYRVIPIEPMVTAFQDSMELTGTAQENLQARVRGVIWMGISNSEGALVLANGNKSEVSVGYSTMYGDTVGGFAPIKDVFKTMVWDLARWRNAEAQRRGEQPPIPQNSIDKPPSAELRPDQVDQDSLPPYEVLDEILDMYVQQRQGRKELLEAGFDAEMIEKIVGLVDGAEWKRRQGAMGTKVSALAFGKDRRLPVTSRWAAQAGPTA